MIGDLSNTTESVLSRPDSAMTLDVVGRSDSMPSFSVQDIEAREFGFESSLSKDEEDALLKDTTGSFADWVTSFIRRVIQLLENLPEEGAHGAAGGASEGSSPLTSASSAALMPIVSSKSCGCRHWGM